jgi:hypothetical protein
MNAGGFHETSFPYNSSMPPAHVQAAQTGPEVLRNSRRYGLACAVVALAGGYAEARYRRVAYWWICLAPAADDIRHVEEISRDLFAEAGEQQQFQKTAGIAMRRLIRGRLPAIIRIAKALHAHGSLYEEDLHSVLTAELGEKPKYLAALDE